MWVLSFKAAHGMVGSVARRASRLSRAPRPTCRGPFTVCVFYTLTNNTSENISGPVTFFFL